MRIRIRRRDNRHREAQVADSEGIIVVVFAVSPVGYTGRNLVFRILSGSI